VPGRLVTAGSAVERKLAAAAVLPVLVLCCVTSGCGSDAGAKGHSEVTIAVTSRGYPEEKLLREIYAHALEAAGFKVVRRDDPGLLPPEELEKGQVSGYPDHLETVLSEVAHVQLEDIPGSAKAAYEEAKRELKAKGLIPFAPASFGHSSAVAVLRKTAEARNLETLSDLKDPSSEMGVVSGEYYCYCHGRECLGSLEREYGIVFKGFNLAEPPPRLYEALRGGETDAAMVLSTAGELARKKPWLVLLEDDEHRLPAANALWLTSQDVIDEAGPDYEKAILGVQKGLTVEVMRELDAAVELEGKPPAKVAAEYLKSIGYAG
jgi:glycine betaine/choline ABC-type transport system substrate-binding protein